MRILVVEDYPPLAQTICAALREAGWAADHTGDGSPVTQGNPPVSGPNSNYAADTTFQAAPLIEKCNPDLAQTPHRSGMIVAFADGSVRTLSPTISAATYWGLITPAGGEVLESHW